MKKRLNLEIDKEIHKFIKTVSAEKGMSMTQWINQAISDRIVKDKDLGF